MPKDKNRIEEDDGRVIAPMDVEGMPWYLQKRKTSAEHGNDKQEELTRSGKIAFTWGVVKAGLLIVAVFGGIYFLFLLFCTKVWFR